ncbi:MAG: L,D-transpeptidase family protein [Asticcacaulis sp.]
MIFTAHPDGTLTWNEHSVRAALGKGGVITECNKREGDGKSPAGLYPLRYVFYRPDRGAPPETGLPVVAMAPDDGWCDDPESPDYNRHVKLPFAASHEALWRDDHVYDLVVVLGHNDDPPVAGLGSAIFMHVSREDYSGTEGCLALAMADLLSVLKAAQPGDLMEIRE